MCFAYCYITWMLDFTVDDACAEFDTRRFLSYSCAEGGCPFASMTFNMKLLKTTPLKSHSEGH